MKKLVLAAALFIFATAAYAGDGIIHKGAPGAEVVPDSYVVTFHAGHAPGDTARELAQTHGAQVQHIYENLRGAAFTMNEGRARGMANNPKVERVEEDVLFRVDGDQSNPTWGIDRVDQRNLPLDNNYHWDFDGSGVTVFILDTGIRTTHNDFGGRASWGTDCTGEGQSDLHGHGSHVAGSAGSSTYGVAKNANLVAVKVCNQFGSCPSSAIACGINYTISQKNANPGTSMVANMSLGGGFSQTSNNNVANAVAAGIFYAVAAGNNNSNACNFSPASEPTAYTVGSTTSSDARSSFSNFGTCLDIFAPGSSITSTWNTSNTATATISGTSMASPHVAGAAALVLDETPGLTPAQVDAELDARATLGVLSSIGSGSPNALLYTLGSAPPGASIQFDTVTTDEVIRTVGLSGLSSPIVVTGPPSFNGNHPSTMRVRNVTASSFQHDLQEWDYLDGAHALEDLGYLALSSGAQSLGSLDAEAGSVNIDHNWRTVSFNQSFGAAPVVVAQVATFNGNQAVTTRIRNVTSSGFDIRLQEEEGNDGTHAVESVHYIAIETGNTTVNGKTLVVGRTGSSITHNFATVNYSPSVTNPTLVAEMQTFGGSDPAALRYQNLGSSSFQVKVEEETSADTEIGHNAEVVGYVILGD